MYGSEICAMTNKDKYKVEKNKNSLFLFSRWSVYSEYTHFLCALFAYLTGFEYLFLPARLKRSMDVA